MTPGASAEFRSRAWGMLALAFHGAPLADVLAAVDPLAQLAHEAGAPAFALALESWRAEATDESADAVRQDFHDLFTVPAGKYVAAYESVYVDPPLEAGGRAKPTNFGASTRAIQGFYRRIGLALAPSYTELPDFVGLELACMEFLCAEEARHDRSGDLARAERVCEQQREFLGQHVARWIPALCARIRDNASTRFHLGLANATEALLEAEMHTGGNE